MRNFAAHLAATVVALLPAVILAQESYRMEIALERLQESGVWKEEDPGRVFEQNDRLRFRFRANFGGYLYVLNLGTSGRYALLFPGEETGRRNRIEAGVEYVIPATQGWFRITGPPGHEIVYWLVSPVELGAKYGSAPPDPSPPRSNKAGREPEDLRPRCDDTIFRARGECVDASAGPKKVTSLETLPELLADVPENAAGTLFFIRERDRSVISSPEPLTSPVVYEFRIAHN